MFRYADKVTLVDNDRMVANETRRLQRQAKDKEVKGKSEPGILQPFVVGAAEGGDLSWTLPTGTDD